MKKATYIISGAFLAMLLMSVMASAAVKGEIGVKGTGLDYTTTKEHRLREYGTLPVDASVSLFNIEKPLFNKRSYFAFRGRNLGEDDVDANLTLLLNKYVNYEESFSKTRHNIASGFATERMDGAIGLRVFPLSKLSFFGGASYDDKNGLLNEELPVGRLIGQKTENIYGGLDATLWNLAFSGSASKRDFSDRNGWSHDADGMNLALSLRPRSSFWAGASYDTTEYTASYNSSATNTVELKKTNVAAQYVLTNKLAVSAGYTNLERTNDRSTAAITRALAREYEDSTMSGRVSYRNKRGSASLSYTSKDRDYTGSSLAITNRQTDTLKLKAATKFSFVGLRLGYAHGYRDISGYNTPATAWDGTTSKVWNYENMSGEFNENNVSATLLGFKYFNLVASSNAKHQAFNANEKYGVISNNTLNRGLTATYDMSDEVCLTLGVYSLRNRVLARESFKYASVLPDIDFTNAVSTSINYTQLGAAFKLSESANLSTSYTSAKSSLVDFQQNNKVGERTFVVGLDKELTKNYSASAEISRNIYNNALDSNYSEKNTLFTLELKKKF